MTSLAEVPLARLTLRDDAELDRAIVEDALRAMCLDNTRIAGSFRARTQVPDEPISIDAARCQVSRRGRSPVDPVAPSYWLPPAVAARLVAQGIAGYVLHLGSIAAIPEAARAICDAAPTCEHDGFALRVR